MKVSLKRTGGLAGIPRQWEIDERRLSPVQLKEPKKILTEADFFGLPSELGNPGESRDVFIYQLEVEDEERRHTVKCCEPSLLDPLRDCIEWILKSLS